MLVPPRGHLVRPSTATPASANCASQPVNSSAAIENAMCTGPLPSCGGIVPPGNFTVSSEWPGTVLNSRRWRWSVLSRRGKCPRWLTRFENCWGSFDPMGRVSLSNPCKFCFWRPPWNPAEHPIVHRNCEMPPDRREAGATKFDAAIKKAGRAGSNCSAFRVLKCHSSDPAAPLPFNFVNPAIQFRVAHAEQPAFIRDDERKGERL